MCQRNPSCTGNDRNFGGRRVWQLAGVSTPAHRHYRNPAMKWWRRASRSLTEKLYASNLATLHAWCKRYGITTTLSIVSDSPDILAETLLHAAATHDAILTSGGAWTGDKDFIAKTLQIAWMAKAVSPHSHGARKSRGFWDTERKTDFSAARRAAVQSAGLSSDCASGIVKAWRKLKAVFT